MEWVETTGRTVDDAKEAALDELGVDEADAEFEVIAHPQTGLFGRLRSEARVRARVRPQAPRAKEERHDRRRRSGGRRQAGNREAPADAPQAAIQAPGSAEDPGGATSRGAGEQPQPAGDRPRRRRSRPRNRGGTRLAEPGPAAADDSHTETGHTETGHTETGHTEHGRSEHGQTEQGKGADVEVALDRQAEIAKGFLDDLASELDLAATVTVVRPDDDTVELQLSGSDLGILIGPKGATLLAVQNLTRTVVFNTTGANNGHINVDVGGYRQKRTEALVRFATQIAGRVKQTGTRTALEPMSSIDRKVVHDTISGIEGVSTTSEGEEPRRRVVVLPDHEGPA